MKVLLVDDDPRFREILKRLLDKKFHAQIFEAEDGLRGIEWYKKMPTDIIFVDYNMPNMNGAQFLKELRQIDKAVPVAVFTSHSDKNTVAELIPYNISDYIIKTDSITVLLERMESIIKRYGFK